ncbi:Putative metallopeptidase domain-containing protein [Billgrantia gudaonensis]|uniref:Putative metallopeptidase domain-containing protein n=2 Tax=Billgrantia gudaonensis TaxID=376427 RepID=A0A1G8Y7Y5_9GAMM|nr:Putative metallopeptidase domain-containing protein [Halomonas gudaonensis]
MGPKTLRNQAHHSSTGEGDSIIKPEFLWQTDCEVWKSDQPATAFLAEQLSIQSIPESSVATATTDGRGIYVNPRWGASLDKTTRQFTHAHLVWHCVAGHFRPAPVLDSRRWHLACDHEINVVLLMLGFSMPAQSVLFPACIGKSLIAVYDWLADCPLLDNETSLDVMPWQAAFRGDSAIEGTPLDMKLLSQHWQHQARKVVNLYLRTSCLSSLMASWSSPRW